MRAGAAAALWGFAEATLFFLVPDVLLSALALERPRRAFAACGATLLGALAGGALMFALALREPAGMLALLDAVPAIDAAQIASVRAQLAEHGLAVLALGAFTGVPYKIYAVQAALLGYGLPAFLAVSVPARLARFAAVTALGAVLGWLVRPRLGARAQYALLAAIWIAFYALYFAARAG